MAIFRDPLADVQSLEVESTAVCYIVSTHFQLFGGFVSGLRLIDSRSLGYKGNGQKAASLLRHSNIKAISYYTDYTQRRECGSFLVVTCFLLREYSIPGVAI